MAYLLSCLLGLLLLDDTLLLLELRSQHVLLGLLVVHRGVREVHLSRDVEGIRRFPSSSLQAKKKDSLRTIRLGGQANNDGLPGI